jgi:C_GCAxxG_C_C family probable redox protein
MDDLESMMELRSQGFVCSQIILKMGLELLGKDNPDLVRAMQGLAGGMGYTGDVCGVLTASVCLLSLYAGRSSAQEPDEPRLLFMIEDLTKWFNQEFCGNSGANHCDDIVGKDSSKVATVCPNIVAATYQKVKELLVENGFDLSGAE